MWLLHGMLDVFLFFICYDRQNIFSVHYKRILEFTASSESFQLSETFLVQLPECLCKVNLRNYFYYKIWVLPRNKCAMLWLVESDHMTWILASYWSRVSTWPRYRPLFDLSVQWPLIGPEWSQDLDTGLLMIKSEQLTWILDSDWSRFATTMQCSYWWRVIVWPVYWPLIGG